MNYQSYGPDQYRNMVNGVYFVIKKKKGKLSRSVMICEGHLINMGMTVINFSLTRCFLQKYREMSWDEEADAIETLSEAGLIKEEMPKKDSAEIRTVTRKRKKMSETEKRRQYFDAYDAKVADKMKNSTTGRRYNESRNTKQKSIPAYFSV